METTLLTIDDFDSKYTTISNHFQNNDTELFETFGEELDYIEKQPKNRVWTLVEGDEGEYIISGLHTVNRVGYYLTEEEWTKEEEYKIVF